MSIRRAPADADVDSAEVAKHARRMGAFVGRDREMAVLEAALSEARGGRGRLVLLVGEPGIGKTRLADELAARAGDGTRVLWGRCWEAGGAPAYWPWIEMLRPLLTEGDAATLASELGPAAIPLASLIPELGERLPGLAALSREDSEQNRFMVFDAVARFLRVVASRAPLVLVLDDLHVADRASLRLLEFVARSLRTMRALVVATYREADAQLVPEVAQLLAKIGREGERLPLQRLKPEDVAALIQIASGRPPDEQVLAAVFRTTEGTPLFVNEVVRALVAGAGRAGETLPARLLVPDGLQPAIRGHLAHISDASRAALRAAAVIGREFSLPLLRAMPTATDSSPSADLADLLMEAERAGLLEKIGDVPPRFRFSHILIRETIYRDLGAAERERLHGKVADALATQGAGDRPERLAELAHHYSLAGAGEARAKAVLYARRAGEQALRNFAHEAAIAHFERALSDMDELGSADAQARAETLLGLAEALHRSGDTEGARQTSARAADCARGPDLAPELLARAALSFGSEFRLGAPDQPLMALLEEALTAIGDSCDSLRARLMARLAAARQPAPDPEQPLALAREAMALARGLGDRRVLASVLRDARAAYLPMDSLEERLAVDMEALALAYETQDRFTALHAHRRLCSERIEDGQLTAALGHLDQYDRLCDELRQPHRKWLSLIRRASIDALCGRFDQADSFLAEAEPLVAATQNPFSSFEFLAHKISTLWSARRDQALAACETRLTELAPHIPGPEARGLLAVLRARLGDHGYARAQYPSLPFSYVHPRFGAQHFVSEIALVAGDTKLAATVYERLAPWARRFIYFAGCEGSYSHPLGQIAAGLGRIDEARGHFEDAIAENHRIGARPWVAHASMAYADLLVGSGAEADRRRARDLRASARTIAESLGMPGILAQLEADPGAAVAVPVVASPPTGLQPPTFDLEGEYWTIRWERRAYRLKDSKGLQLLAYLVKNAGREFHALHLVGVAAGREGGEVLIEGKAAATADAEARGAYKRRAEELREELAEAEKNNDVVRAERAREELDTLSEELARGLGLGGRDRKAGASAERARINIQRRLRDAVDKVEEACPALGRHLDRALRTGAYCAYEPM